MNHVKKFDKNSYLELEWIFRRLEIQTSRYWFGRQDRARINTSSYLFVQTLRAIETCVLDLEFNQAPTFTQYQHFVQSNNSHGIVQIKDYFNLLRYNDDWFSYEHTEQELSEKAQIFLKECNRLGPRILEARALSHSSDSFTSLAMTDDELFANLSVSLNDYASVLFSLCDAVFKNVTSPKSQIFVREREQLATDVRDETIGYVDLCFQACRQIHVICMDLGHPSPELPNKKIRPYASSFKPLVEIESLWAELKRQLLLRTEVIGHFEKLEFNSIRGYSLHCVFLCRHQNQNTEQNWVDLIGGIWKLITQGFGAYHNCNPDIKAINPSQVGVGVISKTESTKRESFNRWVVGYSALSSRFLSVNVPEGHATFSIGKVPCVSAIQTTVDLDSGNNFRSSLFTERDLREIWILPYKSFKPNVALEFKQIQIIYNQISSAIKDLDLSHISKLLTNVEVDILVKIETFITYARCSLIPAFEEKLFYQPTQKDIPQQITRIGKQLQILRSLLSTTYLQNILFNNLKYLSIQAKIFCIVWVFQNQWNSRFSNEYQEVVGQMKCDNDFLKQIRHCLAWDIEYLDIYTKIGHNDDSSLAAFHEYLKYQGVKQVKNEVEIGEVFEPENDVVEKVSNDADSTKMKASKTLKTLIVEKNRITNDKYAEACRDVRSVFRSQDVILICLRFYINRGTSEIPHEIFSPLFTDFLRFGKNRKPLAWSLGYIGRWECFSEMQQNAHVIFFMDANKVGSIREVEELVGEYWVSTVTKRRPKLKNLDWSNYTDLKGSFAPSPISTAFVDFNDSYCRIDKGDRVKQKVFIEQILAYMTKSELYFRPNVKTFAKGQIKGGFAVSFSAKGTKTKIKVITETDADEIL